MGQAYNTNKKRLCETMSAGTLIVRYVIIRLTSADLAIGEGFARRAIKMEYVMEC